MKSILIAFVMALFGQLPLTSAHAQSEQTWLILGDSLSAEYGLQRGTGWVGLLEKQLKTDKLSVSIQNASVSGETTSGGQVRLPALLSKFKPRIVVVELGGNDALRGLKLNATESNFDAMLKACEAAGAKVLLIGMKIPPNYGKSYSDEFDAMFNRLAGRHKAALVPFFFEGFGEDMKMFQADRIHPTEAAQPKMFSNVWPTLQTLSKQR
jgi:acyl-CoA thioesterase I